DFGRGVPGGAPPPSHGIPPGLIRIDGVAWSPATRLLKVPKNGGRYRRSASILRDGDFGGRGLPVVEFHVAHDEGFPHHVFHAGPGLGGRYGAGEFHDYTALIPAEAYGHRGGDGLAGLIAADGAVGRGH